MKYFYRVKVNAGLSEANKTNILSTGAVCNCTLGHCDEPCSMDTYARYSADGKEAIVQGYYDSEPTDAIFDFTPDDFELFGDSEDAEAYMISDPTNWQEDIP